MLLHGDLGCRTLLLQHARLHGHWRLRALKFRRSGVDALRTHTPIYKNIGSSVIIRVQSKTEPVVATGGRRRTRETGHDVPEPESRLALKLERLGNRRRKFQSRGAAPCLPCDTMRGSNVRSMYVFGRIASTACA